MERAVVGAVVCCIAAIPLAIGYSFHGFYSSDEPSSPAYVVVGTAVVVIFAGMITAVSAVCFGIPAYLMTARLKFSRPVVLLVAATLAGIVVHETWHGGSLFEDSEEAWWFAFFGLYSGASFWLGAEVVVSRKRGPRADFVGAEWNRGTRRNRR